MEFDRVDPDDPDQVAAVVALRNAAAAVDDPEAWPVQPEVVVGELRYGYDLRPEEYYLVRCRPGADPVALMTIEMPTRDNLHLLWTEIVVHPDHRRQGHGTQIVTEVLRRADAAGRSTIWGWASPDEASAALADRFGFRLGSRDARRRQYLAELDRPAIDTLYAAARAAASDYVVERLRPPISDDLLAELCAVTEAINDAPMGTLDFEDEHFDLERMRDEETARAGRSDRMYRVVARHRGTGEVAGHTFLVLHPSEPTFAHQADTAVSQDHRGHRLGLLLKIEAMRWLAEAEPQVEAIETWNNVDNTFMIDCQRSPRLPVVHGCRPPTSSPSRAPVPPPSPRPCCTRSSPLGVRTSAIRARARWPAAGWRPSRAPTRTAKTRSNRGAPAGRAKSSIATVSKVSRPSAISGWDAASAWAMARGERSIPCTWPARRRRAISRAAAPGPQPISSTRRPSRSGSASTTACSGVTVPRSWRSDRFSPRTRGTA